MSYVPEVEFISVRGVISAADVVTFDPDADARITATGGMTFQNQGFTRFPVGSRVEVKFRLAGKTKRIADVTLLHSEAPKVTPVKVGKGTNDYYVPADIAELISVGAAIAEAKGYFNLMVLGGSGYGKTTVMQELATRLEMEYMRVDCPLIRDPNDWYGEMLLKDGAVGTVSEFRFNAFVEMLEKGNCVIVLDEINRLETWISNGLFRLLDSGTLVVRDRTITLGQKIIFAATANIGHQYTGTFALDEALQNRFMATINVGAMPQNEEIKVLMSRTGITAMQAERVAKIVGVLRSKNTKVDVSHRASLAVSQLIAMGMAVESAFGFVVGNRAGDVDKKSLADALRIV